MWTFYEKNKQAIHDIVLLLAAVLGCFLFFRYLFRIFLPFLIGWLLSLLFNPLADRLQKFHIPVASVPSLEFCCCLPCWDCSASGAAQG